MITSGIEAIDARLGGLVEKGTYLAFGPPGVGKTVVGIHFLAAGLDRGERVVLVTDESPADVDAHALFVGHGPRRLTESPGFTILQVPDSPSWEPLTDARQGRNWLLEALDGDAPARIVVDSERIFRSSAGRAQAVETVVGLVGEVGATALILLQRKTEDGSEVDAVEALTSGIFELEAVDRGVRRFRFRSVRQESFNTEEFSYTLRSGAGVAEDLPAMDRKVDEQYRRRVVVLDELNAMPPEVISALAESYEVDAYTRLEDSISDLFSGRYGVLVLAVDPYDEVRAFDLTFTLRKAGNGAPIIFIAPSRGLRSTTRARGLRIGGDDFVVSESPPSEIVERIRIAVYRGHHRRNGSIRGERYLQPLDASGRPRPMQPEEFRSTVTALTEERPSPFFGLLLFRAVEVDPVALWPAIRSRVRIGDGDLVGLLEEGRIGVVVDRVDGDLTRMVAERIKALHPSLDFERDGLLLTNPAHTPEIRAALRGGPNGDRSRLSEPLSPTG